MKIIVTKAYYGKRSGIKGQRGGSLPRNLIVGGLAAAVSALIFHNVKQVRSTSGKLQSTQVTYQPNNAKTPTTIDWKIDKKPITVTTPSGGAKTEAKLDTKPKGNYRVTKGVPIEMLKSNGVARDKGGSTYTIKPINYTNTKRAGNVTLDERHQVNRLSLDPDIMRGKTDGFTHPLAVAHVKLQARAYGLDISTPVATKVTAHVFKSLGYVGPTALSQLNKSAYLALIDGYTRVSSRKAAGQSNITRPRRVVASGGVKPRGGKVKSVS